ncbi:tigger transposable element-derived protein 4-like [Hylaeus anthracinus]|uniref:tigger transposable element-derived protein 4-like n=1 Tax=Hylaeus anthracinus TaxID=313031 RepID=UPI0023B8B6C4|nr:tigger transposable element-derived protein 4-like [Hylaeus anthracinus]
MKTMKDQLLRWICEKHAMDSPLDRRMVREKALELTKTYKVDGFKCSNKWITNFLKEHGFSTDLSNRTGPYFCNYRDWIDIMRSTIEKYKHNDVFHMDELTMYSDILPARIASPRSKVSAANRITILMGCNSSGTSKLPLLICGPYPSRTTTKGHLYCHSEDCSISDELFTDWLLAVNDRMIERDRTILLFLPRSRARALDGITLRNVNLVYLPNAFPTHLRPLRRDVFHYVKMIFRRRYAARLERRTSEWNLRDVLESLIEGWERVPREIVIYGFQRTRFRTDNCFMQIDCDCWPTLNTGVSFKRFVTFDDDLSDERVSSERNNRYHGYNLRADAKNLLQIDNEDSVGLTLDQVENADESVMVNRPVSNQNSTPSSSICQQARDISTRRRSRSPELDGSGEHFKADGKNEKRMKTEHDWSKQYETTFVFGSPNANANVNATANTSNRKNCSAEQHRDDKNILDSYIFNATPSSASPRY